MRILLASASPRRLELLRDIGIEPIVVPADIDESPLAGEPAAELALRLARTKARKAAAGAVAINLVLGADTVVVVDGRVLGKPAAEDLCRMLRALSGRGHEVLTGVWLVDPSSGAEASGTGRSEVRFARLSEREIQWYAETGEGLDKAGGYAVQGRAAIFIPEIRGSWSNVVGLPLELVYQLAASLGHVLTGSS